MTEYATTPSALEEWNAQRSRTKDWVQSSLTPELCSPPSRAPSAGSDFERRSLWDGSGWEPPSECESSVSVPPTMMLQYSDQRKVLVSPTQSEMGGWKARGKSKEGTERGNRAPSHHTHAAASSQKRTPTDPVEAAHVQSHSSSARLAQAAAIPLPDSHPSSSAKSRPDGSRKIDDNGSTVGKQRFMSGRSSSRPAPYFPTPPASAAHSHSQSLSPVSPVSPSRHSQNHSQAPSQVTSRPPPPAHSNSISTSLSTVPEPIIIHPPAPGAPHSHSAQSNTNSNVHPRSYVPSKDSQRTLQAATGVPLPPPSTASASLSYYSQSQLQIHPGQMPSHHTQGSLNAAQASPHASPRSYSVPSHHQETESPLYTPAPLAQSQSYPPAAHAHSHSHSLSQVGRASIMSHASQAGLGGGYVVVNQLDPVEAGAQERGSIGGKSTDSQRRRERGSILNMFGSRYSKSRSLPQAEASETVQMLPPPVPDSPESYHSNHSNPYPSPISPTPHSPPVPIPDARARHNHVLGPHPPSIVYAPARHGRASRYSPPRIVYMPGVSPHRREYPRSRSPGSVRRAATVPSPNDGSMAAEFWGTGGPAARDHWQGERRGREAGGRRVGSFVQHTMGAQDVPDSAVAWGPSHPELEGNMAGVGTLRSKVRNASRAKGMSFSTSTPLPVDPANATMTAPTSVSISKQDAGVTPYPTPPGSTGSHQSSGAPTISMPVAPPSPPSASAPAAPASAHSERTSHTARASASRDGLTTRFRGLHVTTESAVIPPSMQASAPAPSSSGRGRVRESSRKSRESVKPKEVRRERRAHSVDSEVSHSSASTYYVIPTPGQKVRIIRTDGKPVTATTVASQHPSDPRAPGLPGSGWLKKALRPRFLHLNSAPPNLKEASAPVPARTDSHSSAGSKRSGRKLVRRGSTGSAALLSRQPSENAS
ncbi:hypothetical protein M0805_009570 [Coniferiporia weirii]|nr:hypothetical protein M0805_009570 [Coniferiporia weirii]